MSNFEITRDEGAAVQFEFEGALVTINADNPDHAIKGSMVLTGADGGIWIVEFHMDGAAWTVHGPVPFAMGETDE